MNKLKTHKIVVISLLIIVVLLYVAISKILLISSIKQPNEAFIQALVEGDITKSKKYAEGRVLWHLNNAEIPKAELENINTSVIAHSKEWAQVETTVEIINNSISDVGWYQMELIKKKDGWKIIGIKQIDCSLLGRGGKVPIKDIENIKGIFGKYLDAVKSNNYQDIGKYLAGHAKTAHEIHQAEINAPIIQEYSSLTVKPLWGNGKTAVMEFTYKVDNRDAQVVAGFYETSQGWKLVKI